MFLKRLEVAVADKLARTHVLDKDYHATRRLAVLLKENDVPHVADSLEYAVKNNDTFVLMSSFWKAYAHELELYETDRRLVIGATATFDARAKETLCVNSLSVIIGANAVQAHDLAYIDQVNDIVFFNGGVGVNALRPQLKQGTTLTFIKPTEKHNGWRQAFNADQVGLAKLLDDFNKQYVIEPVLETKSENLHVAVFGVVRPCSS